MTITSNLDSLFSIDVTGRFGVATQFGERVFGRCAFGEEAVTLQLRPLGACLFGDTEFGDIFEFSGIYARVKTKEGWRTAKRRFYQPTYSNSIDLQDSRTTFALAVHAWQALTVEQKKEWRHEAVGYNHTGYNHFIANYMLTN